MKNNITTPIHVQNVSMAKNGVKIEMENLLIKFLKLLSCIRLRYKPMSSIA